MNKFKVYSKDAYLGEFFYIKNDKESIEAIFDETNKIVIDLIKRVYYIDGEPYKYENQSILDIINLHL